MNRPSFFMILIYTLVVLSIDVPLVSAQLEEEEDYDIMIEKALTYIQNAGVDSVDDTIEPSSRKENLFTEEQRRIDETHIGKIVIDKLEVDDLAIDDVLKLIAVKSGLNIIMDEDIPGRITLNIENVEVEDLLRIVLENNDLAYRDVSGTIHVMSQEVYAQIYGEAFNKDIHAKIIELKHAKASDLLELLEKKKSAQGKIIYNGRKNRLIVIDTPRNVESMMSQIGEVDIPIQTEVFQIRYRTGEGIVNAVRRRLTENLGNVKYDERSNSVIVTDTIQKIDDIEDLIAKYDQPEKKYRLETKVIQILLSEEYLKGVDWEAIVSDFQKYPFAGFEDFLGSHLHVGTVSGEDYAVLLEALDTVGAITNISDDVMAMSEGEPVAVIINEKDLYFSEPQRQEEFLKGNERIRYEVVPNVDSKGAFTVNITPELVGPGWSKRLARPKEEVTINLEKSSTIVIGGVFKKVIIESERKIPFLGDLPILRYAFRTHGKDVQKTEIITFLTAETVLDGEE